MSVKFPVVGSINTFQDVKSALERIRSWFAATPDGANGTFITKDDKTITVQDGRIVSIK